MATIVGAALLSASVKLSMQKIVFPQFVDFYQSMKLDVPLLEKLKITLVSLEAVLNDAEEKQITNPAVKEWLNMLNDAVFDADHLFDEINTEALRCKVEADQVLKKLYSRRFNRKIYSKLKKLFERLEHLRNQNLGLKEVSSDSVWYGTPTSSVVGDESAIYGRDDDKKKLKEFLMSEDGSDGGSKVGVISIVEDALQRNLLFLRSLKIWDCNKLESVSLCGLPIPNLIHLALDFCQKLRSLPEPINILASLQEMSIRGLPNLQSCSINDFPISLRKLNVDRVGGNSNSKQVGFSRKLTNFPFSVILILFHLHD
ncbi:hypothetical protein P8452_19191 [Trifolium repens]|nr:hypothetical protein P8452_19191 [Trifolium repens]